MHVAFNDLAIALSILTLLAIASIKLKLVDYTGTAAAFVVGFITLIFGGWNWFAILLSFYLTSSLLTKYKYDIKRRLGVAEAKGGARAWTNVFGNGGIAALFALAEGLFGGGAFFGGFIGAVSTAAADTLATELGLLYPGEPRLITNLRKKVPPGTSGGVSIYGEVAILVASTVIGLVAAACGAEPSFTPIKILLIAILSGFAGSTIDSILGATVQAQYWCESCKKLVEVKHHSCGSETKLVRGFEFINNHVVNFTSTALGGFIGLVLSLML